MKQYRMEPTHKKCVIEYETFTKLIGGVKTYVIKEVDYRWGGWIINVPESKKEIREWCETVRGETLDEMLEYHSTVKDIQFIPDTTMEWIDIDDYDTEMLEMWDDCLCEWAVHQYEPQDLKDCELMSEEDLETLKDSIEELWEEDGSMGLENDGWESTGYSAQVHCSVTLEECDEYGRIDDD